MEENYHVGKRDCATGSLFLEYSSRLSLSRFSYVTPLIIYDLYSTFELPLLLVKFYIKIDDTRDIDY